VGARKEDKLTLIGFGALLMCTGFAIIISLIVLYRPPTVLEAFMRPETEVHSDEVISFFATLMVGIGALLAVAGCFGKVLQKRRQRRTGVIMNTAARF
jgi:Na+-driven multidrug efflux pump